MIATRCTMKAAAMASIGRPSLVATTTAASRAVGSKCRFFATKTPQKPPTPAPQAKAAPAAPPKAVPIDTLSGDFANPPDVIVEVTPQMKMANVALAIALCGFVGGVWYYSMTAVGSQQQAGKDGSGSDPLAQLKMEAQEAMDRQEKENTPDERAQGLLQEFNRGEHDPDKAELDALEELEQMDADDSKKKKKKSWYKFW